MKTKVLLGFLLPSMIVGPAFFLAFAGGEEPSESNRISRPFVTLYEEGEIKPGHGRYLTGEGSWVYPLEVSFKQTEEGSVTTVEVEKDGDEESLCRVDPKGTPGILYVVQVEEESLIVQFLAGGLAMGSLCLDGTYFRMTKEQFTTLAFEN